MAAQTQKESFLGLEGYHVFITGAAGGIGGEAVREFLNQGCKVSAHDLRPISVSSFSSTTTPNPNLHTLTGDISLESSIRTSISEAISHFGPINILIANAGITDESHAYPIWEIPLELWEKTYNTNIRGTFLTIKHFLRAAEEVQKKEEREIENLAIVVTGSECGKFGQAGHTDYASGKSALQYGLIRGVKNEIVRLNRHARINAVAPGWVDTPLIEGRLDDPKEMWTEAQATVPLRKIAQPRDVARAMAFLASHRAAGHVSGECLSVDGGMEGRVVWGPEEVGEVGGKGLRLVNVDGEDGKEEVSKDTSAAAAVPVTATEKQTPSSIPPPLTSPIPTSPRKITILLSVDFDAVSGLLGTGSSQNHTLSDYSAGFFAAQVGVPRLLSLFRSHQISNKVTWFIPGHSLESFPAETQAIVDSGAEIACHGYAHEGANQMTEEQERDVIRKCVALVERLTGKKPRGWRAPLYQLRENTVSILEDSSGSEGFTFLYDSSLNHHDSQPYFLPHRPPITQIEFKPETKAESWMKPVPEPGKLTKKTLVEVPCNWYMEDMTPLQFWPQVPNSHGYVATNQIEGMWRERFEFLYRESNDDFIFPLVLHPDTSGMAHVIGMIDRMIRWLKERSPEVEFQRYGDFAQEWKGKQNI